MTRKSLKIFTFLILSMLTLSLAFPVKASTWLMYDDGSEDGYTCITSGDYEAVKFMLPEDCSKAELLTVSLFKTDTEISGDRGELIITVLGSDFSTELGSFEVYLDPPGGAFRSFNPPDRIVVPDEFYIVMNGNPETCLGLDSSSSGHSYIENGGWVLTEYDTMVRVEIECIHEPVGGELLQGIENLLYLSILIPLIGVTRYYSYTRKDF